MDIREVLSLLLATVILGLWIASAVWAVRDAKKRRAIGRIILVFVLTVPFAPLLWLLVRPHRVRIGEGEPNTYDNPDEAIAEAVKLDALGDWDQAIALYRDAAIRWPEHSEYIQNSIGRIEAKRALA
jgi:hypothetical protein